jgi:type IV secretion system protein VirB6
MGFAAELGRWLNILLGDYVASTTMRLATLLEPLTVTLAVLYTIVWGYLHLMGRIDQPVIEGVKRIFTLAVVLGAALHLWFYNELIVDTFFEVPGRIAAGLVGAFDQVSIVDDVLSAGFDAASALFTRGTIFDHDILFYFAGGAVYVIVFVTALYALFLLTLSRIALSVLLALGPVFIGLLLFDTTRKFFESWVAQLANYALITLLTVLVAALMMTIVLKTAQDAVRVGGSIEVAQAARLCVAAGLTLLVMRQVMPMAAGLASGLALSTFGVVSAAMRWGLGSSARSLGQFGRGLTDRQTTRWDSLSRKAGYYVQRSATAVTRLPRVRRPNSIRRA